MNPEYMKMNPLHTVPTLNDNGDIVIDPHAICTYLVSKYGGTEHATLCPNEPYPRAKLDQRLHYAHGTLYARFYKLITPVLRGGETKLETESLKALLEALDFLEAFLMMDKFVAGDNLTVADFSCISSVAPIAKMITLNASRHPKVLAWLDTLSKLPFYDEIMSDYIESSSKMFFEKINQKGV